MIHASRRLGQHFLKSTALAERIVRSADLLPSDVVLEIGPGQGVLTRAIARRAASVVAVEKDGALADALRHALEAEGIRNVRIVQADIRDCSPEDLGLPDRYRVVANIPYYLTGRLLRRLLGGTSRPRDIVLMIQREVAERICARPPRMNLLAVSVQAYAKPNILFAVPRQAFVPPPRVDSALIRLSGIGPGFFANGNISAEAFFAVVRAAFRGQRKTIENALAHGLGTAKPRVHVVVSSLGLAGKRPAELSLDQWVNLTRALGPEVETQPRTKVRTRGG